MAHGMDTSMLAKEALLEAMRGQLEALQGKPSGLMEAMPKKQRRRIQALLHMQERCDAYRSACQEKIRQAQKELREQCAPIYVARKDVVVGAREPTADETPEREEDGEGEEGEEEGEEEGKGIPDFWNVVLQSHETTESMVKEQDQEALSHLQDVTCDVLEGDEHGFRLSFHFQENPFFENTVLSKTYRMADDEEPMVEGLEGTEILWKPNQCLTMKTYKKKPKRGGPHAKPVKKTEPCESFFNFFSPPEIPDAAEELDEEEAEQLQEALEEDYEVGSVIRDKLIPQAVLWYTGQAQGYDSDYEEDEEDDLSGSEDEENEDSEGSEEGEDGEGSKEKGEKPPECKEQ